MAEPFTTHTGLAVPLDRINVDTDQIIPKQFLKRIERTGFGQFLFYDWRFTGDGSPDPGFVLNEDRYRDATILVTGDNFGCGSSREHAPWALQDYGFRVIIAPSFADIFYNNCFKNGLLPVVLPGDTVRRILRNAAEQHPYYVSVDLGQQVVTEPGGRVRYQRCSRARRRVPSVRGRPLPQALYPGGSGRNRLDPAIRG